MRSTLLALVIAGSGCRLLLDTGDLQGGAAAVEAGSTVVPIPTPTSDGSAPPPLPEDSGPPPIVDAGVDAPPPNFCLTRGTQHFCADYDVDGGPVGTAALSPGATFNIRPLNALSLPNAGVFLSVGTDAGAYNQARYRSALPAKALKSVTLEFAMRFESMQEATSATEFADIRFADNGNETAFIWKFSSVGVQAIGASKLNGQDPVYTGKEMGTMSLNAWHSFKVVLQLGNPAAAGAGGKFTATFDAKTENADFATPSATGVGASWGPGQYVVAPDAGVYGDKRVRFDNIVVSVVE